MKACQKSKGCTKSLDIWQTRTRQRILVKFLALSRISLPYKGFRLMLRAHFLKCNILHYCYLVYQCISICPPDLKFHQSLCQMLGDIIWSQTDWGILMKLFPYSLAQERKGRKPLTQWTSVIKPALSLCWNDIQTTLKKPCNCAEKFSIHFNSWGRKQKEGKWANESISNECSFTASPKFLHSGECGNHRQHPRICWKVSFWQDCLWVQMSFVGLRK